MPSSVFPVYRAVAATAALALFVSTDGAGVAGAHAERIAGAVSVEQAVASRFALATVADRAGKALVDIGVDDFVVQEAGANREVLDVRVADYPVAIVIDNGSRAGADFLSIRAAVGRFIDRLGPRPLALVTTAPVPTVVAGLDDERATVISRLDAIDAPSAAEGQPLRAAALAAQTMHATGALFSAIVVVTATQVEVEGTAAEPYLASIIDSGAVVHVVARATNAGGATGWSPPDVAAAAGAEGAFRSIAQQMHGEFAAIYASPSYQPALDHLVTRLTTELLVEYIVPVGSKALDVTIGVRIPGARVRGLGVAPR
jgi:hypothetical protein